MLRKLRVYLYLIVCIFISTLFIKVDAYAYEEMEGSCEIDVNNNIGVDFNAGDVHFRNIVFGSSVDGYEVGGPITNSYNSDVSIIVVVYAYNEVGGLEGIYSSGEFKIAANEDSYFYQPITNEDSIVDSIKMYDYYAYIRTIDGSENNVTKPEQEPETETEPETEDPFYDNFNKKWDYDTIMSKYQKYLVNAPESDEFKSWYDYYLSSYNVDVVVNENNTFDITENIWADFNVSKHGIVREIPLKNNVTRLDGTSYLSRAEVSKIAVNKKKSVSSQDDYKSIKIGDKDINLIGQNQYIISYRYNIGEDKCDGYDEFYFNIIGNEWDTYIENVSFKIEMPKEFDETKLGFSYGKYGSIDSSDIHYVVEGNTIIGVYDGELAPGEALTVRMEVEEGYFNGKAIKGNSILSFINRNVSLISIIVSLFFVICAFIIWFIHGRDDKVVKTIEFNPPEGINSLDLSYIYSGTIENEGIISLLLYLASKGYVAIDEYSTNSVTSNAVGYNIRKLKEYDGNNECERLFMKGLFKTGDTVSESDLKNSFYKTVEEIKSSKKVEEKTSKIFEPKSLKGNAKFFFMIIAILILINLTSVINENMVYSGNPFQIIIAAVTTGLFSNLFMIIAIIVFYLLVVKTKDKSAKLFALVWCTGFGGIPWCSMVLPQIIDNKKCVPGYMFGLICIIIIFVIMKYMPKRTPYGNQLYGRILGFKDFLNRAEKDKLEMLVMENPTYFYDILPYAYVLDVSDKWINKFEDIILSKPDWYKGSEFGAGACRHFMNSSMKNITGAMTSSPSSSGGGSSSGGHSHSGGGHSGGGHGGGGGHSW